MVQATELAGLSRQLPHCAFQKICFACASAREVEDLHHTSAGITTQVASAGCKAAFAGGAALLRCAIVSEGYLSSLTSEHWRLFVVTFGTPQSSRLLLLHVRCHVSAGKARCPELHGRSRVLWLHQARILT